MSAPSISRFGAVMPHGFMSKCTLDWNRSAVSLKYLNGTIFRESRNNSEGTEKMDDKRVIKRAATSSSPNETERDAKRVINDVIMTNKPRASNDGERR